ncbi:MAG TPA: hypothetical protein VFQ43_18010, partial [Nitrososphaera sp.]|nr:hypothetical protein [Nitrososphaera sp.]
EQADFVAQLSENLVADFGAVEDSRGHSWLAFFAEGEAAKVMIAHGRMRTFVDGKRSNSGASMETRAERTAFGLREGTLCFV